jgi:four helix bundle protein
LDKTRKIENPLLEKTYALSLLSVKLYKEILLTREYVLSRQFLRCSTSPGAMAEEAQGAHSKKDFIAKLEIGLKEVKESKYWLRLLIDCQFVDSARCVDVQRLQNEVEALLTTIIISAKKSL